MVEAFTLIELLVVLAIITILAGMLLPALSRAKANVQTVFPFRSIARCQNSNETVAVSQTQSNLFESAPLEAVLETALYVRDLDAAEHFYSSVLGLTKIFNVPNRQLVFRVGQSILLIFNPEHTTREQITINGGAIPLHGAHGPGHMAFRVPHDQLDVWRNRLRNTGVAIESELSWPNGAHSIYFRDPEGNSLEFATPDLWRGMADVV